MDRERGIVIGERYRVAGSLRRVGLVDALDEHADPALAACRVVGIPGDAAGLDAWEDAWREAQEAAPLPRLREVVVDDEGAAWAVVDASLAVGPPPPDAAAARSLGATLARAGLDADEVSAGMLAARADGALVLDGVVRLAGALPQSEQDDALSARQGGERRRHAHRHGRNARPTCQAPGC